MKKTNLFWKSFIASPTIVWGDLLKDKILWFHSLNEYYCGYQHITCGAFLISVWRVKL